jgi:hypothetical protein
MAMLRALTRWLRDNHPSRAARRRAAWKPGPTRLRLEALEVREVLSDAAPGPAIFVGVSGSAYDNHTGVTATLQNGNLTYTSPYAYAAYQTTGSGTLFNGNIKSFWMSDIYGSDNIFALTGSNDIEHVRI